MALKQDYPNARIVASNDLDEHLIGTAFEITRDEPHDGFRFVTLLRK